MRCPRCTGKIRIKTTNNKIIYKCRACKREYIVDVIRGGLKQVS